MGVNLKFICSSVTEIEFLSLKLSLDNFNLYEGKV